VFNSAQSSYSEDYNVTVGDARAKIVDSLHQLKDWVIEYLGTSFGKHKSFRETRAELASLSELNQEGNLQFGSLKFEVETPVSFKGRVFIEKIAQTYSENLLICWLNFINKKLINRHKWARKFIQFIEREKSTVEYLRFAIQEKRNGDQLAIEYGLAISLLVLTISEGERQVVEVSSVEGLQSLLEVLQDISESIITLNKSHSSK